MHSARPGGGRCGSGATPVIIGPSTNDGVVNSAYQLAHPDELSEFGGLVIGDHGDVFGHYPRVDPLTTFEAGANGKRAIHAGLFHSGAGFRDDQFFDLYRRVATKIREAAN